jgi:excisionase family DNA binding protein
MSDLPMTTTDVATYLNVDRRTVMRWAHTGRLPAVKTPGGHLRFARDDVAALPLTTGEFARLARVGRRTVVRWCQSGQLKAWRRPGSDTWEIAVSEAEQLGLGTRPPGRAGTRSLAHATNRSVSGPDLAAPGGTSPPPSPSGIARNPVIFSAWKRAQKAQEEITFGGRPEKKPPRRKKTTAPSTTPSPVPVPVPKGGHNG